MSSMRHLYGQLSHFPTQNATFWSQPILFYSEVRLSELVPATYGSIQDTKKNRLAFSILGNLH